MGWFRRVPKPPPLPPGKRKKPILQSMQEGVMRLVRRLVMLAAAMIVMLMGLVLLLAYIGRDRVSDVPSPSPPAEFGPSSSLQSESEGVGASSGSQGKSEPKADPRGIWVDPYTRDDGVKVRGHWRKRN